MKPILTVAILTVAVALGACRGGPTAEVARFHTSQPINRGALFLQPTDPATASGLEFRTHAESVAVEMRRHGFQTVPSVGQAQYVATIDITQTDASGSRGSTDRTTALSVILLRQTDNQKVWEGRAINTASVGSQQATLTWAVPALADALFREFPGPSGVTHNVRI